MLLTLESWEIIHIELGDEDQKQDRCEVKPYFNFPQQISSENTISPFSLNSKITKKVLHYSGQDLMIDPMKVAKAKESVEMFLD